MDDSLSIADVTIHQHESTIAELRQQLVLEAGNSQRLAGIVDHLEKQLIKENLTIQRLRQRIDCQTTLTNIWKHQAQELQGEPDTVYENHFLKEKHINEYHNRH